jgi:hypothetical protein
MAVYSCRDRIDPTVYQQVAKLSCRKNFSVAASSQRQFLRIQVADNANLRTLGISEIAYQVWTPVSVPDYCNIHRSTPLFPKHSAFGWIDIEMKNQGGLPSTYSIPSTYTTEMPASPFPELPKVLHQLERSGYHMRRVVPTLISPAFFNSTPRGRLMC